MTDIVMAGGYKNNTWELGLKWVTDLNYQPPENDSCMDCIRVMGDGSQITYRIRLSQGKDSYKQEQYVLVTADMWVGSKGYVLALKPDTDYRYVVVLTDVSGRMEFPKEGETGWARNHLLTMIQEYILAENAWRIPLGMTAIQPVETWEDLIGLKNETANVTENA